eukprot:COSAG02_NODE_7010_length_3228_cov_233.817194_2_plen_475_part_00
MPVTNPSKLKSMQHLKRSAAEGRRQGAPTPRAMHKRPLVAPRRHSFWCILLLMFFGFVYVLRVEQDVMHQAMFHGSVTGFKQDGRLRDLDRRGADSTCDEIFATDWRFEILRFAERGGIVLPGSVYVFGVFNGWSTKLLRQFFPSSATWGFDSFQGLPEETDPEPTRLKHIGPGTFRSVHSHETLRESIFADESNPRRSWSGKKREAESNLRQSMVDWGGMVVPTGDLVFEAGWFEDTFAEQRLAASRGMEPAAYIDMDVTLYSSTFKALDWMFGNGLVQKGTLIGYEGFWTIPCVAYGGESAGDHANPLQTAAGRAHREIAAKYGVRFACAAGPCGTKQPPDPALDVCTHNGAAIFQVQSLGDAASTAQLGTTTSTYESGFKMSSAEIASFTYERCAKSAPCIRYLSYIAPSSPPVFVASAKRVCCCVVHVVRALRLHGIPSCLAYCRATSRACKELQNRGLALIVNSTRRQV